MIRLLVGCLALSMSYGAFAAPTAPVLCAEQGGMCTYPADALLTFGGGDGVCDFAGGTCTGAYTPLVSGKPNPVYCHQGNLATYDPRPGDYKACFYVVKPDEEPAGGGLNWSNSAHVTQALIVAIASFALLMGYRAGDKL